MMGPSSVLRDSSIGVVTFLAFAHFVLMAIAMRDFDETNGPKWMWGILIVFVPIIGPVLYLALGRRAKRG